MGSIADSRRVGSEEKKKKKRKKKKEKRKGEGRICLRRSAHGHTPPHLAPHMAETFISAHGSVIRLSLRLLPASCVHFVSDMSYQSTVTKALLSRTCEAKSASRVK
jgi:hypothetical protein